MDVHKGWRFHEAWLLVIRCKWSKASAYYNVEIARLRVINGILNMEMNFIMHSTEGDSGFAGLPASFWYQSWNSSVWRFKFLNWVNCMWWINVKFWNWWRLQHRDAVQVEDKARSTGSWRWADKVLFTFGLKVMLAEIGCRHIEKSQQKEADHSWSAVLKESSKGF